ncbi:MAG: PIG-L family deacetylase [Candidatus Omnitrophica bacterium]|nr:PIG-L family deacetylase [Candidatus Omnitrophota bacterium]
MRFLKLFLFSCLSIFFAASFLEAQDPPVDLVVFAPHPDDEALACGQTIIQGVKEHKKIKVVFLTNGDGSESGAAAFANKPESGVAAQDYIALGQERQEEALRAAIQMGLPQEDLIFLGYPDDGLIFLWGQEEHVRYRSEHTNQSSSIYKKTWGRAKSGYSRENLTQDIKDILKKYQPKIIYSPSPLDKHKDHVAGANFLNKALDELKNEQKDKFINPEVFYYIIHTTSNSRVPAVDLCSNGQGVASSLKLAKAEAIKEYRTQLVLEEMKKLADYFIQKDESFYHVPDSKEGYLARLGDEWSGVAARMKSYGYNLNLGVVADVAGDINDSGIVLVKKEKIFSDNPELVFQLVDRIVQAHNSQDVIPVVKHFPGLGSAFNDTHKWLPKVDSSKSSLEEKDLAPYKKLIRKNRPFMIMTSHAIYPALDNKPASLSYKIQSQLLRKKLGFKGLIISDELLNMQAMGEYALQQGIAGPFIGEIAAMSFSAGTDMVIIYPDPEKAEEVILTVLRSVKKAVKDGKLTEREIDDSVSRILKEKEKVFGKPLAYLLKAMSFEDKICQKIIIDTYGDAEVAIKYNLGGIHVREYKIIPQVQARAKTPFFIAGQHEGGGVIEVKLDLDTQSAYLTGREFERIFNPQGEKFPPGTKAQDERKTSCATERSFFDFSLLSREEQERIINILAGSVDGYIKEYTEIKQRKILAPPNPDFLSPLYIDMVSDAPAVILKDFRDLPIKWLRNFPDRNTAICAYKLFKETFLRWDLEEQKFGNIHDRSHPELLADRMILKLTRLQEMLSRIRPVLPSGELRVLCLAAHPDDEEAESLAYFKKRFNAKTYILLATRGEAGENQISPVLYDDLGFLRTEEMERAAQVLGVDRVYYLNKKDFGYCFDPQEAFQNWGKQETLLQLVYFFRLIRPDIVITEYTASVDHCAHQALNILGQEAFDLSGDPKTLPEMIKDGLPAWQADRVYQRKFAQKEGGPLDEIAIDPDELIPSVNKTYRKLAEESLSEHKSQGEMADLFSYPGKIVYGLVKKADDDKYKAGGINPGENSKAAYSGFPGIKIAAKLRIGLIERDDNILFASLKILGCDLKNLDEKNIRENDLSGLDTILIGKGADKLFSDENIRKQLEDFTAKGGNLVVLFQPRKPETVSIVSGQFQMIFDGIVDPASPVTFLVPEHPLFNWPNKVSAGDFSGWRQERGLFFPEKYDRRFKELTSCPDFQCQAVKSGYLVSDYGRGSLIFSTFSWNRQLREFHPGALKNLANMISYPLKETRHKNNEDGN